MSDPLRVMFVLTHPVQYFSPWFREMAADQGIDVTVLYATTPSDAQRGVGFDTAVDWATPLLDGYPSRVLRPARPGDSVSSRAFFGADAPGVGRAIDDARPDVVVVPGWHSSFYWRAIAACWRRGIPVLYRGDTNLASRRRGWLGLLAGAKYRVVLRFFDAALAVGQRSREFLLRYGTPASKIVRSPHAVDNDFFARGALDLREPRARQRARSDATIPEDAFVVLFVGKLVATKRPLDLVRAMAQVDGPSVLVLVGTGRLEAACRELAGQLGVRLVCAGFQTQAELPRWYGLADCLCLPSGSETWGLVANEALASGVPCVVSDACGCAVDLVQAPLVGSVYPVGDVNELANQLTSVRERGRVDRDEVAAACRRAAARATFASATRGVLDGARIALGNRRADARTKTARVLVCGGGMVVLGGAERMTCEVARLVISRGGQTHVLVNDWGSGEIIDELEAIGATWGHTWTRAPLRRKNLTALGIARYGVEFLRTGGSLLAAARRFQPTCVFVPDYTAAIRNSLGLLVLRLLGVSVVNRLQNAPDIEPFYRRLWSWIVSPLTARFVCNSHFTAAALVSVGIPARKISTIYNTLPTRRVLQTARPPQRDPSRVVYVGQVIPPKGLDRLLDAIELLVARGLPVSLDVVGDVDGWISPGYLPYREAIKHRVGEPPLAGRVRLLGWQDDVSHALGSAAVHCCPSLPELREAFGLVVLEAKHMATPSVIFCSGALPELVSHREDGWVCRDATAEQLAEGIAYFLQDPQEARRAGARALASTARFSRVAHDGAWWPLLVDGRPAADPFLRPMAEGRQPAASDAVRPR